MEVFRILALGAFSVPYIKDNWCDSIKHVFPDTAVCLNVTPFISKFSREVVHEYVFNLIKNEKFDYIFFYFDWIYHEFGDEFFDILKHANIPISVFYPDDEPEGWYNRNIKYDHLFSLVATHSALGIQRRIKNHNPDNILYLPWGYNHRIFQKQRVINKIFDIVFIGKNKAHKNEPMLHREDGKVREDSLLLIADQAKKNHWRFGLFGFGWDSHPRLSEFSGGQVDNDTMVRIYNQAKIVFNPAWSNDDIPKPQTKLRHFEVAGAGAFQLTNYNPELSELFKERKEICFYSDNQELLQNIGYFLDNDVEREQIATAGYERAANEHTLDHRVTKLFSYMASKWPPSVATKSLKQPLNIHQIRITNRFEIPGILKQLRNNQNSLDSFDAIHYLAGNFLIEDIEYVQVSRLIQENIFDLLAVRTFFDYQNIVENWLQPSGEEIYGEFLNEHFQWEELTDFNRINVNQNFVTLENRKDVFFLSNFIAKPSSAIELLEAFHSRSFAKLKNMNIFNTGYLINHLIMDTPEGLSKDVFEPNYMRYLKPLLKKCAALNQRIVIYGAKGLIAETVLELLLNQFPDDLVGIIDNGLTGKEIQGRKIFSHQDIFLLKPDVVVIAASVSGPEIYESLKLKKISMQLIPLFDLEHAIWRILLP